MERPNGVNGARQVDSNDPRELIRAAREDLRAAIRGLKLAAMRQERVTAQIVDARDEARRTGRLPAAVEITGEHVVGH